LEGNDAESAMLAAVITASLCNEGDNPTAKPGANAPPAAPDYSAALEQLAAMGFTDA